MKRASFLIVYFLSCLLSAKAGGHFPSIRGGLDISGKKGVDERLIYPLLVDKFYLMNGGKLFWFTSNEKAALLRRQLLNTIDTASFYGLIAKPYHFSELKSVLDSKEVDSLLILKADRLYTDAAIAVFKDVYQGYKVQPWVGYDQLSEKYAEKDNDYLLHYMLNAQTADLFKLAVDLLEPFNKEYLTLKLELKKQKEKKATDSISYLLRSMNYFRWIHHFQFDRFIVVNLAAARLQYFEKDSLVLDMKAVVGKPSTPTPRFATYCDQVILYPYLVCAPEYYF